MKAPPRAVSPGSGPLPAGPYLRDDDRPDGRDGPLPLTGASNEGATFDGSVPVRRPGDYVIVTVPEPCFEPGEDLHVQRITKPYLNRGTIPTGWSGPQGLITEIDAGAPPACPEEEAAVQAPVLSALCPQISGPPLREAAGCVSPSKPLPQPPPSGL